MLLVASDCEYSLSTPSDPPEGGTVRRDPDEFKIPHGDAVVLTAVPNEGFVFSHWEPSGSESTILSFNMGDRKATRTAVFTPFDPNLAVSQPPSVTIVSPTRAAATEYRNAESILFSGTAVDPEDGDLTGESFVWTSDVDGQIGTGASFSAVLSSGRHTVTLTATDSDSVAPPRRSARVDRSDRRRQDHPRPPLGWQFRAAGRARPARRDGRGAMGFR